MSDPRYRSDYLVVSLIYILAASRYRSDYLARVIDSSPGADAEASLGDTDGSEDASSSFICLLYIFWVFL